MPRVASGWITPLCPAGHLLLKGGDWLHRRPTLAAVPPAVVIGCAGWRDATRPAAGQAWMATTLNPDICVIGGTAGGVAVAAGAAAFGVPVVLVEKGRIGADRLGGDLPAKALRTAAAQAEAVRHGGRFGIAAAEPDIDFRGVTRHVRSVVAAVTPNHSAERLGALGVQVIAAEARFVDARTLVAGECEIRARRFVVATGSTPAVPPIAGLDQVDSLTTETVFDLIRLPGHLVVVGGGSDGLALAQAFRRLGSRVTVVEAAEALAGEDPELAACVLRRLRAEGVDLRERTSVVSIERRGRTGLRMLLDTDGTASIVDVSHLLLADRRPDIDGLGLDAAGIRHDAQGIAVGNDLRTSNRRVYALGEAIGGPPSLHLAEHQGTQLLRALLFRRSFRIDGTDIPRVTWTDPELAQVGLTEAEARRFHRRISILRWPYSENARAQAARRTEGFIKILADRRGRILGAGIAGAGAPETIAPWALALRQGLTLRDMAEWVPPSPTFAEIGKRAAIAYFAPQARRASVRWLVRFLRRFG